MNTKITATAFLFISLLFTSCLETGGGDIPSDSQELENIAALFEINGNLRDSVSMEPLEGISVKIAGENPVFSNADGNFSISILSLPFPQLFSLEINSSNYENYKPEYYSSIHYVAFPNPVFKLNRNDLDRYGSMFFGRCTENVNYLITPKENV